MVVLGIIALAVVTGLCMVSIMNAMLKYLDR